MSNFLSSLHKSCADDTPLASIGVRKKKNKNKNPEAETPAPQMGLPTKQSPFMCSALLFDTDFASFPFAITSADFTNLVYKGCANQKFQDPSSSQTLKSLFDFMVSQSSQKTVYTSTSGEGQNAISVKAKSSSSEQNKRFSVPHNLAAGPIFSFTCLFDFDFPEAPRRRVLQHRRR
ncbi:hypothetical protein GBA52_003041 [Prunus armeniaca]|nr:hypothetical protein GBA52_003041 [Prunus armeniaca]